MTSSSFFSETILLAWTRASSRICSLFMLPCWLFLFSYSSTALLFLSSFSCFAFSRRPSYSDLICSICLFFLSSISLMMSSTVIFDHMMCRSSIRPRTKPMIQSVSGMTKNIRT